MSAQQDAVRDGRRAAFADRVDVIDVAPGGWPVAAGEAAASIAVGDRPTHARRPHPGRGPYVEWLTVAVDDDPHQRAVRQLSFEGGGTDRADPVHLGRTRTGPTGRWIDLDPGHDLRPFARDIAGDGEAAPCHLDERVGSLLTRGAACVRRCVRWILCHERVDGGGDRRTAFGVERSVEVELPIDGRRVRQVAGVVGAIVGLVQQIGAQRVPPADAQPLELAHVAQSDRGLDQLGLDGADLVDADVARQPIDRHGVCDADLTVGQRRGDRRQFAKATREPGMRRRLRRGHRGVVSQPGRGCRRAVVGQRPRSFRRRQQPHLFGPQAVGEPPDRPEPRELRGVVQRGRVFSPELIDRRSDRDTRVTISSGLCIEHTFDATACVPTHQEAWTGMGMTLASGRPGRAKLSHRNCRPQPRRPGHADHAGRRRH